MNRQMANEMPYHIFIEKPEWSACSLELTGCGNSSEAYGTGLAPKLVMDI